MKIPTPVRLFCRVLALAAWLGGNLSAPAQPAPPARPAPAKVQNRFLLVFDTSSDMKRRLPAVRTALNNLLAHCALSDQLKAGDSIGVWTFDETLRTGEFPLQRWKPDNAALIASNINAFVSSQRYSKKSEFQSWMPMLDHVVEGSERLTVVIFCDGYGEFKGSPYDKGINQIFEQRRRERQKARAPIAIVIRSQLGHYVDCIVSFPPQAINLPAFPPLPPPPAPPVVITPPPQPKLPPLIIIGTPHTNPPPAASSPVAPAPPERAPAPAPAAPTERPPAPAPATSPDWPNPAASAPPAGMFTIQTNVSAGQLKIENELLPTNVPPTASTEPSAHRGAWALGIVLLVMGTGIVAFRLGRARR